ncbi:MAG: hypothetical protein ABH821_05725, partial [archaeon]
MFEIAKQLLIHKTLKLENGKINLFCHPVFLTPVSFFNNYVKKSDNAKELYYAAKEEGIKWFNEMEQRYGNLNHEKTLTWGCKTLSMAGLGTAKLVSLDVK